MIYAGLAGLRATIHKYCSDSGKESRKVIPGMQYHLLRVYLIKPPFTCSAFGFFTYKIALSAVFPKIWDQALVGDPSTRSVPAQSKNRRYWLTFTEYMRTAKNADPMLTLVAGPWKPQNCQWIETTWNLGFSSTGGQIDEESQYQKYYQEKVPGADYWFWPCVCDCWKSPQ